MNHRISALSLSLALLSVALAGGAAGTATAQVAGGTTTVGVSVSESTQLAMGWSVKKSLLGKGTCGVVYLGVYDCRIMAASRPRIRRVVAVSSSSACAGSALRHARPSAQIAMML